MSAIRRLINKDKTIYIQPLSLKIVTLHTVCRTATMRFTVQCSTRVCKDFHSTAVLTHSGGPHVGDFGHYACLGLQDCHVRAHTATVGHGSPIVRPVWF